jgi:hypothetical protein
MDSITAAILTALGGLSHTAVKDAYNGLKGLIARKFGADSRVSRAIEDLEAQPESEGRKAVLQEEVAVAGALNDAEVAAAVRALLEQTDAGGARVQAYASGERSVAVGGSLHSSTIVTGDQPVLPRSDPPSVG